MSMGRFEGGVDFGLAHVEVFVSYWEGGGLCSWVEGIAKLQRQCTAIERGYTGNFRTELYLVRRFWR